LDDILVLRVVNGNDIFCIISAILDEKCATDIRDVFESKMIRRSSIASPSVKRRSLVYLESNESSCSKSLDQKDEDTSDFDLARIYNTKSSDV
jgi:hypothetical protein